MTPTILRTNKNSQSFYELMVSLVPTSKRTELTLMEKVACLVDSGVISEAQLFSCLASIKNRDLDNPVGYFRRSLQRQVEGFEDILKNVFVIHGVT